MRKLITIMMLITYCFATNVYASRKDQTPWWTLKKHWDDSVAKDDKLSLEYMSRVAEYDYTVPHDNPIRKVAVLPPPPTNRFALKSLGYFEQDVLFNMKEMEEEFLMEHKKWTVTKSSREAYEALVKAGIYDEYTAWVEAFLSYRIIDKTLFTKMKDVLGADTFLLLLIGNDRPGAVSMLIDSEAYYQDRLGIHDVFLFSANEGKIVWEYGALLKNYESYKMTRWRGIYKSIFEKMPLE